MLTASFADDVCIQFWNTPEESFTTCWEERRVAA